MQRYLGTVLNHTVNDSRASQASLYEHLPESKEQFVTEAVRRIAQITEEWIRTSLVAVDDRGEPMGEFILRLAHYVKATGSTKEGGITTIALESITTNERTREVCKDT